MSKIETFEAMLQGGQDNALLRYSLANAFEADGQTAAAIEHLLKALEFDAQYSAAWKLLGKCYVALEQTADAIATFEQGVVAADAKGDKQAAKEMQVFLRRLRKAQDQ